MNINNKKEMKKDLVTDMYSILLTYLRYENPLAINGPLNSYEDFCNCNKWEVSKIEIEGKPFLILDIDFESFSFCKIIKREKKILKSGLSSSEAIQELKEYSKYLGINILNQYEYFHSGDPRSLRI